jgi:tRNA-splicing ligase RtcB (3'-phosphate/5'-hydroxy nucleic acid ligase)
LKLQQIDDTRWRIPREGRMRVEGIVYASAAMMEGLRGDPCLQQVANVAHLPGILRASMAMPDIHWGYGFPIGGVAATDADEGVISPGGVGYDINCGVRLLRTDVQRADLDDATLTELVHEMFRNIPTGVGEGRRDLRLSGGDLSGVLRDGAAWAVDRGLGYKRDLAVLEEGGSLPQAEAEQVSARARQRGGTQLGSLGSGNHFAEVQRVAEIFDDTAARAFGLRLDQVTVMIHSGSRGLGHQVCTDHLKGMLAAAERYGIELPDRQLACAPLRSPEGQEYLGAMRAAANFAWANRQWIAQGVRRAFGAVFGRSQDELGLDLVYDVAHNIAKLETHATSAGKVRCLVHRKGATRAFPAGHPDVPAVYRAIGQPVLVPGDMGRYSFVLVGSAGAMAHAFGSTCHGAGRNMSRTQAVRETQGRDLVAELKAAGVVVRYEGRDTLREETSEAYKDAAQVVRVCEGADLSRPVAKLEPFLVVKG